MKIYIFIILVVVILIFLIFCDLKQSDICLVFFLEVYWNDDGYDYWESDGDNYSEIENFGKGYEDEIIFIW